MNPISRQRESWQNFTRGAEIWLHQTRMMVSSIVFILICALLIGFVVVYLGLLFWATPQEMYYFEKYIEASFKGIFFSEHAKVLLWIGDEQKTVYLDVAKHIAKPFKEMVMWKLYILLIFGLSAIGLSFMALMVYLTKYGKGKMKDDHLRGGKSTTGEGLRNLLIGHGEASSYSVANVPLRKNSETLHFLLAGATGTGKSVAILELLDQIRAQGKRAAIYDPTGQFIEHFYRPGKDIIRFCRSNDVMIKRFMLKILFKRQENRIVELETKWSCPGSAAAPF